MAENEARVTPKKVVVIGGGVAGLTAAHELQERGFKVVVYERNVGLGGKARSFPVPDDHPNQNIRGLPAEHGFRFFPGFYKHLADTLSRIPSPEPGANRRVVDRLIETKWAAYARRSERFFRIYTDRPETVGEWVSAITGMFSNPALGVPPFEAAFAAFKLAKAMTMCPGRREEELDGQSWWDYMQADDMSPQYQSVIVNGLTQNFVAMDARNSSTKSVINILARLLDDFLRTGRPMDRILDGPTSEVWIEPWVQYLAAPRPGQVPVMFRMGRAVHSLVFDEAKSRITGIRLRRKNPPGVDDDAKPGSRGGPPIETDADYFVVAVPLESMQRMLYHSPTAIQVHAPSLADLEKDELKVNWMSGIMYYLKEDTSMEDTGHVVFLDSPWALTAISQNRFWWKKLKNYGTGKASGILSVIISDWGVTSPHIGKSAFQTDTPEELAGETLGQIRDDLSDTTLAKQLYWNNIVGVYRDPAMKYAHTTTRNLQGNREEHEVVGLMPGRVFAEQKAKIRGQRRLVRGDTAGRRLTTAEPPRDRDWPSLTPGEFVEDPTPDEFIERNLEPLFINTTNSWQFRPRARTEIGNLFLASDYVRTNTDLATMEGANEAARHAVNGILDALGSKQSRCSIFEFDEPDVFAPFRVIDQWMYNAGFPRPRSFDKLLTRFAQVRHGVLWKVAPVLSRISKIAEHI